MDETRFNPVKKIGGWSVERDGRCMEGGGTCMYMYVLMFLLIGSFRQVKQPEPEG